MANPYSGRNAITGSLMKQGGGGLFGGGLGSSPWMSPVAPQRSAWGSGMMQGASGGPPGRTSFGPGINNFNPGGGMPPEWGSGMPSGNNAQFGGGAPLAAMRSPWSGSAPMPTSVPTPAPTPPPAPMATPAPTSSLGQPAAAPPPPPSPSAMPGMSGWNPAAGVNGNWGGNVGMVGQMGNAPPMASSFGQIAPRVTMPSKYNSASEYYAAHPPGSTPSAEPGFASPYGQLVMY